MRFTPSAVSWALLAFSTAPSAVLFTDVMDERRPSAVCSSSVFVEYFSSMSFVLV